MMYLLRMGFGEGISESYGIRNEDSFAIAMGTVVGYKT